jgi:flagellar basal body-associated protein FliL
MDKEKVKKSLDQFEDEEFVDSKETLKSEIKKKVNDYLKNKTGVQRTTIKH